MTFPGTSARVKVLTPRLCVPQIKKPSHKQAFNKPGRDQQDFDSQGTFGPTQKCPSLLQKPALIELGTHSKDVKIHEIFIFISITFNLIAYHLNL